jgi:hypothetical protein
MTKPKQSQKEEPKKPDAKEYVEASECQYVAYCTEDGVCPYNISDLMKKGRLQAIKDTLELIKLEKGECPTIQIEDEIK